MTRRTPSARFGAKDTAVLIVAAMLGSAIWMVVPMLTGRAEAWDVGAYWIAMAAISFVLGLIAPARAWRWGLALVAGQMGAVIGQSLDEPGNLWPLGLALLVALAAFCSLLSWLGGFARSSMGRKSQAVVTETP